MVRSTYRTTLVFETDLSDGAMVLSCMDARGGAIVPAVRNGARRSVRQAPHIEGDPILTHRAMSCGAEKVAAETYGERRFVDPRPCTLDLPGPTLRDEIETFVAGRKAWNRWSI
jgi:hypothetical protein